MSNPTPTLLSSALNSLNNVTNLTTNTKKSSTHQSASKLNEFASKTSSLAKDTSDSQNFEINQELNQNNCSNFDASSVSAASSGTQAPLSSNNPQDNQTRCEPESLRQSDRRQPSQVGSRNIYPSGQYSGEYNNLRIQSNFEGGLIGGSEPQVREERGDSFCDTISSSKSSCREDNSMLLLEDESNSSDAGISSHDDEFDRLNRIGTNYDDDFDYKIKWFFDRIEQSAAKQFAEKPNVDNNANSPQDSSFSGNPIESDSHSTNEDSASNDEATILGKRKRSDTIVQESTETSKRQKTQEEVKTTKTETTENAAFSCFFPQFQQDFARQQQTDASRRRDQKVSDKGYINWTPELQRGINTPLITMPSANNLYYSPQLSQPKVQAKKPQSKTEIFEKAALIAKKFKGECLSQAYSICKGKNSLKFKCLNNHTFFIPVDTLESMEVMVVSNGTKSVKDAASSPKIICSSANEEWCYKCRKFYNNCKEVAAEHGIVVVDGLYSTKITLKCEKKDHQFKISYTKKLHTLSCSDCRREEREEWKEQLKQEEQRKNEFYQRQQRELFEQARREMEGERHHHHQQNNQGYQGYYQSSSSSSSQGFSSSCGGKSSFDYYTALEEQINLQAQKLTIDWLRKNKGGNNNCNVDNEKVFIVYKFIQTPIEALTAGMKSMMRDQAIQYFRRLAKLLHPDKNQHPLAKEAFQKLSEAVQVVSSASGRAAC